MEANSRPVQRRLNRAKTIAKPMRWTKDLPQRAHTTRDLPKRLNRSKPAKRTTKSLMSRWNKFMNYTRNKLRWMRSAKPRTSKRAGGLEWWLTRLRDRMKRKMSSMDYKRNNSTASKRRAAQDTYKKDSRRYRAMWWNPPKKLKRKNWFSNWDENNNNKYK